MATDFRDGKTFPRRGREPLGEALWLARVIDKARASAASTIHDYIYPCPMDAGVMQRWGITPTEFEAALRMHADDAAMLDWLMLHSSPERIRAANAWLLSDRIEYLNRQDAEEGVHSVETT
ncbi:MAG: DUF5069 domain-containing protein [Vulcanimicrobiaceae bacterium]